MKSKVPTIEAPYYVCVARAEVVDNRRVDSSAGRAPSEKVARDTEASRAGIDQSTEGHSLMRVHQ
jgi:hypothetical protein